MIGFIAECYYFSLKDTEVVIDKSWREHNRIRPHSSINGGYRHRRLFCLSASNSLW